MKDMRMFVCAKLILQMVVFEFLIQKQDCMVHKKNPQLFVSTLKCTCFQKLCLVCPDGVPTKKSPDTCNLNTLPHLEY